MLTAVIVLSIVSVILLSALIFAVAKGIKYYAKYIRYEEEINRCKLKMSRLEKKVKTDTNLQRNLLVELTDSLQVLVSDIFFKTESTDSAIAHFKKDIDVICAATPKLFSEIEE